VIVFTVRLTFHGDLIFFLRPKRQERAVERQLTERTSVKDVIESCGIPHTEVDLILVNGQPVDFALVLEEDAAVDVYPVESDRATLFPINRLQLRHVERFIGDGHLGKLTRDLRLLGLDVLYDPAAEDRQLLDIATTENRALLTRDRRLLMHAVVQHGYYLRSQQPLEQTMEVLRRFDLLSTIAPFTRCLRCNAPLERVEKADVIQQLEPLTKIYYEEFRRCTGCDQVYWAGSHFDKLQTRIKDIRAMLPASPGKKHEEIH
jgi:uncharacterized protein with PIN domain